MKAVQIPGYVYVGASGLCRRILRCALRPLFGRCGRNVRFDPFDSFSYPTIFIGSDVFIGKGASFSASRGNRIEIGCHVMFGPGVKIMAGDHNLRIPERFMTEVREKRPEDDRPVIIGDDVWIGAGAVILKGVSIDRGAVVGAGAVVTKSIACYAIAVGNPARVMRARFSRGEAVRHEEALYPRASRLSREILTWLPE